MSAAAAVETGGRNAAGRWESVTSVHCWFSSYGRPWRGWVLDVGQGTSTSAIVNTAVAGDFVYWMVDPGSVFRRPLSAGPGAPGTETLHVEQTLVAPDWMRALGSCVYYSMGNPSFFGSRVRRVCSDGAGAQDLFVTNATSIDGFDADASGAYFVLGFNAGATSINRVGLAPGQAVTPLLTSDVLMEGLAMDATFVYFVEPANDAIWRIPKGGGAKSVFAQPIFRGAVPDSITADGSAVYWVDDASIYKKVR